jgi:hypothetical protein
VKIGDGTCHDLVNTRECDYDGGDCCLYHQMPFPNRYVSIEAVINSDTINFDSEAGHILF